MKIDAANGVILCLGCGAWLEGPGVIDPVTDRRSRSDTRVPDLWRTTDGALSFCDDQVVSVQRVQRDDRQVWKEGRGQ